MKKSLLFVVLVLIFIVGCSSLDSRGFYMSGEKQGIHKVTETNYDLEGYNQSGYDKNGYNKEGYDKNGFNREGFDLSGFDQSGYDKNGYNKEGYDSEGYDKEGYNKSGWNKEGINKNTLNKYDKTGYDQFGYNEEGYNQSGYNKEGYDLEGYDKDGYNREGYDKNGNDRNYTGIWEIRYYVDEFKEPTNEAYISNKEWIKGTFSNSATTNSKLNILFLIDKERISIKLAEYGSQIVKKGIENYYDVLVQDTKGNRINLVANNYSDRLTIAAGKYSDTKILHAIFQQEGEIKFAIKTNSKYSQDEYFFTVNTKGYKNVYRQLFK